MKIGFCSDLHLDHCDDLGREAFSVQVARKNLDVLLIAGDIATAPRFSELKKHIFGLAKRTFFVLGNHDFYGGSIYEMMQRVSQDHPQEYLTSMALPVELTKTTCLIGEDCWGDMTVGNRWSRLQVTDHVCIEEFQGSIQEHRLALGEAAAARLLAKIISAITMGYQKIYILTHVPVFEEVSFPRGLISHGEYMPYYICGQAGDVVKSFESPELVILSGHCHHAVETQVTSNIKCLVADAEYRSPKIHKIWEES